MFTDFDLKNSNINNRGYNRAGLKHGDARKKTKPFEGTCFASLHYALQVLSPLNKHNKDVHIIEPFAYLLSSYSKIEWAENSAVQACTKKLSGEQICCTINWFL